MSELVTASLPISGPPPADVILTPSPLVRVLAQVQFPTVLLINEQAKVAPFQDELRAIYPQFHQESGQNLQVELAQSGPSVKVSQATLWRFADVSGEWIVSLTTEAITLETSAYTDRSGFIDRLSALLSIAHRHFSLETANRIGIRYITRVAGERYDQIEEMIQPALLGLALPAFRDRISHSISEAAIAVDEGNLLMRWGMIPAHGTIDPYVLQPDDRPSWVLDIDVSATDLVFDAGRLSDTFKILAQRAYSMFRFVVTDRFLTLHGGTL